MSIRALRIRIQPEPNALLGARIFVSGALLVLIYTAFSRQQPLWLAYAAALAADWGVCLWLTFSQRIELQDGELVMSSAIGRRSVRLDSIDHVQIGRVVSATPRTIRLVLRSGAPLTWAVRVFGRNLAPVMAALAEQSRIVVRPSAS